MPELRHSSSYPNLLDDPPSNVSTGHVEQHVALIDTSVEREEQKLEASEEVLMDE